ncbi:MAG: hypothetical protein RMJ36_00345 [Candidatus Calescibacterium sp.]|nr:hypothetical protein [Candidatus Calescibacterium sp.]MDW8132094.1 hypothetical protein [Candidatus Calescibacterium sp.]
MREFKIQKTIWETVNTTFFILLLLLGISFSNSILTAEGSIKYIGKGTTYSPPFIVLSSSQRFYVTEEVYNKILSSEIKNKHLYFKIEGNKVVSFNEQIPQKYNYTFPEIMKIDKFEFDEYRTLYIIWYFNFSPFVEITTNEKNISIFYTSPNSITLRIPKNYKNEKVTLKAVYKNQNINQIKKYSIKIN